jgi:hypothetical protein
VFQELPEKKLLVVERPPSPLPPPAPSPRWRNLRPLLSSVGQINHPNQLELWSNPEDLPRLSPPQSPLHELPSL